MELGFVKIAVATPELRVADCEYNTEKIINTVENAVAENAELVCFPRLSITGSSCGDLFWQQSLQKSALKSLQSIAETTKNTDTVVIVGLPFSHSNLLYSCAAVISDGEVIGMVPQTNVENRQFASASAEGETITLFGKEIYFGTKQIFAASGQKNLCFAVELGDDLSAPITPGSAHALNGANIIINLSSDPETVGRGGYRRRRISDLSDAIICGYVYANAGTGESTTDSVHSGHSMITEIGEILAESAPFSGEMVISDIDVDSIAARRIKSRTFMSRQDGYKSVNFNLQNRPYIQSRTFSQTPFVPEKPALLAQRCRLISAIQSAAIQKRLKHTGLNRAVIGVSGGLDSSLAILATAKAFADMELPLKNIIAVTMPCFGTTARTKNNALSLCEKLSVTVMDIDISDTVRSHFNDIKQDERHLDTTFENAQARVRTLTLLDIANREGAIVIGTGNMSELALGWATFNGDHISMYAINSSIPKTLVKAMVDYIAQSSNGEIADILKDILDTPISPELLPSSGNSIAQQTERLVGPYILHDFFLYHFIHNCSSPKKILSLAQHSFSGMFSPTEIKDWLTMFCRRFFGQQFKRNCVPDGPCVGELSLSPRGGLEMPSDAVANGWLRELED